MRFTLQPVKGEKFINRAELLEEMVAELKDKRSTVGYALYGKRRIGKTSILKEIQRRLEKEDEIIVIYFSVWDLIESTLAEFCQRLSMEVIDAYRPHIGLKYRAKELIQTPLTMLRKILDGSEFKVVYNEIEFLLSRKRDVADGALVEHAFSISEKLAENTDTKCILLIDEFPSIIDLKSNNIKIGEAIIRKIRTIFEDWERTSLCISGSIRSTMNLAVLSSSSPFYRQLIVKEIKPLEREHVGELLSQNLEIPYEGIEEIYNFSAGIPFYVQFMGKMLEREEKISLDSIKKIEHEFLMEEGNILFKEEFGTLGPKERLIVINIANGCHAPKELANATGDKISNVSRFLTYLREKGYISKAETGYYVLEDPVFERWLKEVVLQVDVAGTPDSNITGE
ncbi:MAG: ATP-binding protein [Methanosarcinales archaeon Met12]|nr:MAG: ATP-binding protein [Methanosarcinales archaeon Met12]